MFSSNDSIKFMMAKVFFNLAEFSFKEINEPTNLKFHGVNTFVIYFIKEGKGKLIIEDKEYDIKENSYFTIPSFIKYQIIPIGNLEYYSSYFLIDRSTGYQKYLYLFEKCFVGNDKFDIYYLYEILLNELMTKQFGYNEVVVSMFKSIIVNLLRNENVEGERLSHWNLENSQFQIEQIFENEFQTITLESLAEKLFMSTREVQRYLKDNYKKSFIDLRNDARMSFAANKLRYTNLSVSEISELVGYSSIEHFSNAFKSYYKISPLKYRKEKKD